MTRVERLAALRRHLDHLRDLRSRVSDADALRGDISLHNDVLFSLQMVCQLVIDIAGELSAQRGLRFEDYTAAIRNLSESGGFSEPLVKQLERLPGFRNVLIHAYIDLDLEVAMRALDRLDAVEEFASIVRDLSAGTTAEAPGARAYDLDDILEHLDRHRQAATYGAVAGLVGGVARGLMRGRPRSWRDSWIVGSDDLRPGGYRDDDLHPELLESVQQRGALTTARELAAWLEAHP